jgi:branched-chain amino acid transport system substrate-binding protein
MGLLLRYASAGCAVLVLGFILAGCQDREPMKIGFVGSLTGRNGDLGTAGRDGAQLAVDTINAAGGINDRTLELVIRDDKNEPEEAKQAVKELANTRVTAIVGPMTSAMAGATLPIIDAAGLVTISPTVSGSGKDFTARDDYFFRLILNSDTAKATAERMRSPMGIKNVAVVYDMSNKSFSTSLVDAFKTRFLSLGGAVVVDRAFNGKEKLDFMAIAKSLSGQAAQGVVIVAGAVDSAMICQQLKKLGSNVPVFIVEWGGTNEFIKAGGNSVEGVFVFQHFNSDSTTPAFIAFKEAYSKRFGEAPSFAAAYSHEAVTIIAEALRKNPQSSKLKETIIGIRQFSGLQGKITLDHFGDPERLFSLMQVRDGRFVRME